MARRIVAVMTSVSLVAAAVAAPMTHLHDDDHATDHHDPHAVHAHLSGHAVPATAGNDTEFGNDESEHTVFLQLFIAVAEASIDVPAAFVTAFQLAAPEEAAAHLSIQIAHGHDPPFLRSVASRAPPRLPVLI